jgi:hypothetical protein
MANSIGWGNIYCSSNWGDEDYNTRAIGDVPTCFGNAYIYADAYVARAIAAIQNYRRIRLPRE